jgi:hypothetical protein
MLDHLPQDGISCLSGISTARLPAITRASAATFALGSKTNSGEQT